MTQFEVLAVNESGAYKISDKQMPVSFLMKALIKVLVFATERATALGLLSDLMMHIVSSEDKKSIN